MSISKKLTGTALFLSLATFSCKNADEAPTPVTPATSFSASIDGKPFYAEEITGTVTATVFSLKGLRNRGSSKEAAVQLNIPHYAGLGSYPIDTATSASYAESGVTFAATSGTIEVTTANEVHVKGLFSFEAASGTESKQIAVGKFDLYK